MNDTPLKMNTLYNMDCMDGMALFPDNFFDLAIVDPPYGIGKKFSGGKTGKMNFNTIVEKQWDIPPSKGYFKELFRVSKNQIIWGGNYFSLPATRCFIVWDKLISDDFSLAMAEYAWTSFDLRAKIFRYSNPKGNKIHKTQKPRKLYRYLLSNYAENCETILDTHAGSCSSCIEFEINGFQWIAFEKDVDYFNDARARMKRELAQGRLEL